MGASQLEGTADASVRRKQRIFLSVAGADGAWGEWLYRVLTEQGHEVDYYRRSFPIGANFVARIDAALTRADRMIAALTPHYCDPDSWVSEEWQAALQISRGRPGFLAPLLIEPCRLPPLLAGLNHVDLTGLDEISAAHRVGLALRAGRLPTATDGQAAVTGDGPAGAPFPRSAPRPARRRAPGGAVTILHLTDLVAADDAGPGGSLGRPLYADLDRLAADGASRPDVVLVSGVARRGRRSEYSQARRLLVELADRLGIGPAEVVVVPGRGDVSAASSRTYFAACEEDETEPVPPYWRKWRHFVEFFDDFYQATGGSGPPPPTFAPGQEWTLFTLPSVRLAVAGLNTTMAMSHRPEDDYGEVGSAQAAWFAERMGAYAELGWLRLAAGHQPPLDGAGHDTRTRRDATNLDLTLGRHLNLLVAGLGDDGASAEPARLPRSEVGVVSGRPARATSVEPRAGYQLLRLHSGGIERWDRRFSERAVGWRPDDRHDPSGRVAYRRRWPGATATFPRRGAGAQPLAARMDNAGPVLGERVRDGFAERVSQVARLRHRDAQVDLIEAAAGVPAYLRVTVADGPVAEQRPLGLCAGDVDETVVAAFADRVHAAYAATDATLTSHLIYGGEPAAPNLVAAARARGVRLRSFVEYQGLLDLRDYVRRQTEALAADRLYPPSLYLPQRYRLRGERDDDAPRSDLLGRVVDWLGADAARFVLILGDFGRGKTFLLRELARTLPARLPGLTPVLVDLRRMEKAHSVDELVASHLVAAGQERFDVAAFRYMLRSGRIVLLFDGFDELALRVTYETAAAHLERLLEAVDGQAKIVVSSRTQHFLSHHQVRGVLGARVELLPASRIAEVEDFTPADIREFLVRLYDGDTARAAERLELIHDIRDLLGLSRNPRMLGFIAGLDAERLRAARSGDGTITSADLYAVLIDSWLRHEEDRARPQGSAPTLSAEHRRAAVTALALVSWRGAGRLIGVGELTEATGAVLADLARIGLDDNQAAHMIGSGSLLTRTEDGAFTFIHQSVMEFLIADLASGDDPSVLSDQVMSPLMIDFYRGRAGRYGALTWARAALRRPDETAAGRANALAVARLLDPTAAHGARLAGAELRGLDLSGLDLSGADLRRADLAEVRIADTDLSGADLSGARLTGARLERVDLSAADLSGADLTDARLERCLLARATVTDSEWRDAALLGVAADPTVRAGPELAVAAVAGRDPASWALDPAGPVYAVAFAPDGAGLAYAVGNLVLLTDVHGQRRVSLTGHTGRVCGLAWSPDGRWLASGGAEGAVLIWSARGERVATLDEGAGHVAAVRFSPDGRWLVAAAPLGAVLWDVAPLVGSPPARGGWKFAARRLAASPEPDACAAFSVDFTPDGQQLMTGHADGVARLWDLPAARLSRTLGAEGPTVQIVAVSPDGRWAAASAIGGLALWELASGRTVVSPIRASAGRVPFAFSPDGGHIATVGAGAGVDQTVRLLTTATLADTTEFPGRTGSVWSLAYAPTGDRVATGGDNGTVRIWSTRSRSLVATLGGSGDRIRSVAFAAGGSALVTESASTRLRRWDLVRAEPAPVSVGPREASASDVPADGILATGVLAAGPAWVALVDSGGAVRVVDCDPRPPAGAGAGPVTPVAPVAPPVPVAPVVYRTGSVPVGLALSADGRRLATRHTAGRIRVWAAGRADPIATIDDPGAWVYAAVFSPQGDLLVTAGLGMGAGVWDASSGRHLADLLGPNAFKQGVRSVVFSADGALIATGDVGGAVRLWNARTYGELGTLAGPAGHAGSVRALAFSPDGVLLATAGDDGAVRLWSVPDRTGRAVLRGHAGGVWCVAFSPDGRLLASGSEDGGTRLWDVASGGALVTLAGVEDRGWAALFADGSYRSGGDLAGALWWSIGQRRFPAGELDPYVPEIRRRSPDEPTGLVPRPDRAGDRGP